MKRFGGGALAPVNEELKEWDLGGKQKAERGFLSGERVSHPEMFNQILWGFFFTVYSSSFFLLKF